MLNVCKRLKTEVARRVLNRYKRLVKESNIDNQGFMEFDAVERIGGGGYKQVTGNPKKTEQN